MVFIYENNVVRFVIAVVKILDNILKSTGKLSRSTLGCFLICYISGAILTLHNLLHDFASYFVAADWLTSPICFWLKVGLNRIPTKWFTWAWCSKRNDKDYLFLIRLDWLFCLFRVFCHRKLFLRLWSWDNFSQDRLWLRRSYNFSCYIRDLL